MISATAAEGSRARVGTVTIERARRPGPSVRTRVVEHAVRDAEVTQVAREDRLVTEEPLEIRVRMGGLEPRRAWVTMRTPGHDFELAAGWLVNEGLAPPGTLEQVAYCTDVDLDPEQEFNVVTATLSGAADLPHRHVAASAGSSACGVCGKDSVAEALQVRSATSWSGARPDADVVRRLPEALRERQDLFSRTGGVHAARAGEQVLPLAQRLRQAAYDVRVGAGAGPRRRGPDLQRLRDAVLAADPARGRSGRRGDVAVREVGGAAERRRDDVELLLGVEVHVSAVGDLLESAGRRQALVDQPARRQLEVVPGGAHGDPGAPRLEASHADTDLERLLGHQPVLAGDLGDLGVPDGVLHDPGPHRGSGPSRALDRHGADPSPGPLGGGGRDHVAGDAGAACGLDRM